MTKVNYRSAVARPSLGDRQRWVVLGVGVAAQASFSVAFQGILTTGPLLRTAYQLTLHELGLVLGAISLGIAVSEVFWGILTDKLGDRFILLLGLLSTSAIEALLAVFDSPQGSSIPSALRLCIGFLAVGILGGSINGSSGKAVMSWFKDGERGLAMSIRQTAVPAGGGIGALLLPWLAEESGFMSVFATVSFLSLATAAATWFYLGSPDKSPASPAARKQAEAGGALKKVDIWRLFITSGLLTVPQIAILTFSAVYLTSQLHADITITSGAIFTVQVLGATARVWSGRWTDRHDNRRSYVRYVALLAAIMFILLAVNIMTITSTPVSVFLLICGGVFGSAWHGVAYTEVAVMAGASRVGTALGIENTAVFVGAFVTPAIIPECLEVVDWSGVWGGIGLICVVAMFLAPKQMRRTVPGRP
jgi:sugar phosphate permease